MKKALLTVLLTAGIICSLYAQQGQFPGDHPRISVNGEAVVRVQPDQITITFGIETWDTDILIAKEKNNEIMKKAAAVIRNSGIQDKDIQTDYLSIEPRYTDSYERKNFIGYFVRNTIVVTLTKADKVENLVTDMLQSGVNYIHNINFQTSEFKKYREQARELALNAAKEKAEKMAGALGQTVGNPVYINEGYTGSDWWYYNSWSGWGYGRSDVMSQNVVQNIQGSPDQISETIALGKISIKATVNITFELRQRD